MLIESGLLSVPVVVGASLLAALTCGFSLTLRPWRGWLEDGERRAVWAASLVLLGAVWSLRAGFVPGQSLRFLLVTASVLLHGRALTILGAALVLVALSLVGVADWVSFGPNLLCTAVVPALFAGRLHEIVHRRLPHNYFVYFFLSVFLGSALAWNVAALARGLLLLLSDQPSTSADSGEDLLALLPLMSFGEAFINGLLVATAAVYRPRWVMSFDAGTYFARR
ncbi:MAG: energy-coupling factor ABC transporter permease [Gammaproteobacteria bacterium]|nr:energy-coupling factor ABC transporter permease [Gammaproteobacteria bacterium]